MSSRHALSFKILRSRVDVLSKTDILNTRSTLLKPTNARKHPLYTTMKETTLSKSYALFVGATPADKTLGNSASPIEYSNPIAHPTTRIMITVNIKKMLNGTDISLFWQPYPPQYVTDLCPSSDFNSEGLQVQDQHSLAAFLHSPWDEHELVELLQRSLDL
jgi:hypothetical protein